MVFLVITGWFEIDAYYVYCVIDSPVLRASFVLLILLNVNGWYTMFWASLIHVVIILAIGTKLQAILEKMAIEITRRHFIVQGGIPVAQDSDKYFCFGWPELLLPLIHFVLFHNSFQYSFGMNSLILFFKLSIILEILGVGVLCLCSYITLPLYALVTQLQHLDFVIISITVIAIM
ncbi:MLO-like protein 10 [Cicer arietinum]|uniref:MLO-like protein 10 n=1 Tax=Cicer arietinum TaxID=3827 RepID=UPI003CC675C0